MADEIMERMRVAFRAEALDLLPELDAALLSLEAEPGDIGLVNRVFRAIHTIKGSGATAGFAHLARFTHGLEGAFDLARAGRLEVTTDLIDCALEACDVIRELLGTEREGGEVAGERAVLDALALLLPSTAAVPAATVAVAASPAPADRRAAYEIVFRPNRGLFGSGTDPVTLLDELRDLGAAHVTARTDEVPELSALDPESCYLWWEILLVTERGETAIREVFEFVEDECQLVVRLLADQASAVALLVAVPAESLTQFVLECEDHLASIEAHALALEQDPGSRASLDALFRSVHSVKGNAGVLLGEVNHESLAADHPLPLLMRVAHAMESLLDPLRVADATPPSRETIQTALETGDAMRGLVQSLASQKAAAVVAADLRRRLQLTNDPIVAVAADPRHAAFVNTATQCMEMIASCLASIEGGDAAEPILQMYLRGVKTLAAAAAYLERPDLEAPVILQLTILVAALNAGGPMGDADVAGLKRAFDALRSALDRAEGQPDEASRQAAKPATEATADGGGAGRPPAAVPTTIRIDQEKLDRLMRVVGELLVARGALPVLARKLTSGVDISVVAKEMNEAGVGISRIADELQNSVMAIRMLPVKTVFQKFPRLVRDLARSLGKEVQFAMEGESIELDKTIIEQIGDPLVHLIRNAIDHGLEMPDERTKQGKDPAGKVTLRAMNEAGAVVIEVVDDGPGLDAEALKRKAIEKGLLTPEAASAMGEAAAFQLIFAAGLSTAKKVTDVSGRGVGMDVVKNNIHNLHGTIDVQSTRGGGTAIAVKLPTSLMIAKGILVTVGDEEYVLPLGSIRDMVKIPAANIHLYRGTRMVQIRGEVYSVVSLAELFGQRHNALPEVSIAIVEAGKTTYGLLVDRFVSEVEVIVKPLVGGLQACREFQGAAILGDGRVVLVLNPAECHRVASIEPSAASGRALESELAASARSTSLQPATTA